MVTLPKNANVYEFVVIASLRAKQLLSGCTPRVGGDHSAPTMAQMEVAGGQVGRSGDELPQPPRQCEWQL